MVKSTTRRRAAAALKATLLGAAALAGAGAAAQLGLPRVNPGPLVRELPPVVRETVQPLAQNLASAPAALPQVLRVDSVRQLLRDQPDRLEADPAGHPMRRRELLWLAPPPALLDSARALGFTVLRELELPELDLRQVVLRPPEGLPTAEALARLRALGGAGVEVTADYNHLYLRSGGLATGAAAAPSAPAPAVNGPAAPARVGLVDGGVDRQHPALRSAALHGWGCEGRTLPSTHGTAVASLLVGRDAETPFAGSAPGATLWAADIYCGDAAGGAVETLAAALAWLVRERVAVVNLSLVGPHNQLLEQAVRAMQRRGHVLVAAVGNDGPAAPPLYPAALPGVVGVTGTSPARRVLPEALQGPQVSFAAPGSELAVAQPGGGWGVARGTSFAAPLVAGLLAPQLPQPDPAAAAALIERLARQAQDLGPRGRDPVYGHGLLAEDSRVPPARVAARPR